MTPPASTASPWRAWLAMAAVAAAGVGATPMDLHARSSSSSSSSSWQSYVRSPSSTTVTPVGVMAQNTTGDVSNPDGMITGRGGPTVFTRSSEDDEVPTVIVDFGQDVVGIVTIEFAGSRNLSEGLPGLQLAFSETTEYLTNTSDFTRSDNASGNEKLTNGTDQIAVKNSPYIWQDINGCEYGTQVCADGLHGFRYLKIWLGALAQDAPYTSALGSVSIKSLRLDWSGYLGTPDTFTGWFECSDADLTQWWFDGVYTTDMCTDLFTANTTDPRDSASPTIVGKQVLFDGAKRDRDPYSGDIAVSGLTSYLSHDFPQAARDVLEDLALHQRDDGWIPPASINDYTLPLFDYPLWWVVCSVDLVMYTGNTTYADAYWDVLVKTLDTYYPGNTSATTGLLDKTAASGYGDYAFLPRSGQITYYSALYVHALKYAAKLASSLGSQQQYTQAAERWSARAANVSAALLEYNFDKAVGAFFDGGPCPGAAEGTVCDVHAQDGNGIAVLAGAVDTATATSILDYWAGSAAAQFYGNAFYDSSVLSPSDDFDQRVYAFISYFELAARFATPGAAASAFDELRRLYGWMAAGQPGTTFWEGIGPGGQPYEQGYTSMAHGWSTGIVPLLSSYVLGVTPLTPGFARWQVCPVVDGGGLTWARGAVPTPRGALEVSWQMETAGRGGGEVLVLTVSAPAGTSGIVCVPTAGFATSRVEVDGKQVSGSAAAAQVEGPLSLDGYVVVEVSGGSPHAITVGS